MKRRMLSLLLVMVMVLGMLPTIAFAAPIESSGVYQIGTAEDLLWFAQEVNGGNTGISGVLTADIDMSAVANWPGIGTATNMFAGSFDGQGHTVTFTDADWGLFGYVMGTDGNLITIQNVTTVGSVNRSAISHEAGFTHFKNCINRATISAKSTKVGGILGTVSGRNYISQIYSDVRFTNCGNEASITGFSYVGGILGYNSGAQTRLTGCYNTGNIHGSADVGGMVGFFQGSTGSAIVDSCYNTGRITGSGWVGGIVGEMENGAEVRNSYNSGSAYYAIAGERFNQTAKIINCYYLGTASAKCSPDYNETTRYDETTNEIATRATAVSGAEMATAEFAALLGDQFVQSCPTPVLSWQTAKAHTGAVCANCKLGSTEKEIYDVTFQQHVGYTLNGESKATQGQAYSFTITITEGYEPVAGFAVKVNGEVISPTSNGKYTVLNVKGPISVTVLNVKVIPGNHSITLPGEGYGYRIAGDKYVKRDEDYTFNLTFVDGFKAGTDFKVMAQEIVPQSELDKGYVAEEKTLTGNNGTYTIPNVQKDYRILVSGVVAVPTVAPVTVNFTVTEGWYEFHKPNDSGEVIIDKTITVPYFDLSLYGLEKYYYNPYCYLDEDGNIRNIQQKGTPETAYNNITAMHAFIVATELFYLGYSQDQVGTGRSYREMITVTDYKGEQVTVSKFANAISWSQDAGSSFMDFWDHGTNLNYYINYAYPLAYPGWGSTSDQEVIKNGDVISVHLITGVGSGSNFGFFTANDTNNKYNPGTDVVNEITVDQGVKVKLTYFWTATSGNYNTSYKLQKNKQLYWIYVEEDGTPERVEPYALEDDDGNTYYEGGWRNGPLGKNTVLKTDNNGVITIDTAGLEPGTYYIGGIGGFEEGGGADNAGFVSAGYEAGASFFKIVVQEYNGKTGDLDGDTEVTGNDALMILRYVANAANSINDAVADVDGDGMITGNDALMILRYVAGAITNFPVENP